MENDGHGVERCEWNIARFWSAAGRPQWALSRDEGRCCRSLRLVTASPPACPSQRTFGHVSLKFVHHHFTISHFSSLVFRPLPPGVTPPSLSQSYLSCTSFFRLLHSTLRFLPCCRLIRRLRRASDDPGISIEVHFGTERGRWGVGLDEPFSGRDGCEFASRAETSLG